MSEDNPTFGERLFGSDPENEPARPRPASTAPRKPPADKPMDAAVTKVEVRRGTYHIFNGIAGAFGLPDVPEIPVGENQLHFEEDEFDDSSEVFMILFNQHSQVRILWRLVMPIVGVATLVNQIRRLIFSMSLKRRLEEAEKAKRNLEGQPMAQSTAQEGDQPIETGTNGVETRGSFFPRLGGRR